MKKLILLFLLISTPSFATCVWFDDSEYTQEEKNLMEAAIYALAYEKAGLDVPEKEENIFCVDDKDGQKLSIITQEELDLKIAEIKLASEEALPSKEC